MDFLLSIVQNDLERTRQLLQSGVDVNSPVPWNTKNSYSPVIPSNAIANPDLFTHQDYYARPLNIAVLGGHVEMVGLLLSAGADINMKDGLGRTALICAIYGLDLDAANINASNLPFISQSHKSHLHIMKNILLQHPNIFVATLNAPQYEIKGITPLCLASYLGKTDIIQLLLEDGRVDVDGTDSKNATALMYAARDGNLSIVQALLNFGASPDLTDSHGWSAIQYAERNPKIVQMCEHALRRKRPDVTAYHVPSNPVARYPSNYAKLSTMIANLPQYKTSLSHVEFAALNDLDLGDPTAGPIVQLVQSAFLHAIKAHDHSSLQSLLLWSPPLQCQDQVPSGTLLVNYHDTKTGLTCVHHAMRAKPLPSLDTIAMLYQAGADVNAQTYYGRTALHHLARIGTDNEGKTWGIQKSNKTTPTRLRANSNASAVVPDNTAASSSASPAATSNASSPTATSPPAAMSPVTPTSPGYHNRLSTVSSRSNASDGTAARASMVDVMHDPLTKSIMTAPTVPGHLALCASLLIRFGALVNIADPTGNTPLHFAAEFGAVREVLEVLVIEGNADLYLKNKKQQTPLDICKTDEIRKCLLGLEQERKSVNRNKSLASHISGNNIKPFDTASDYHQQASLSRSVSISQNDTYAKWSCRESTATQSVILPTSISEVMANKSKEMKKKGDVLDQIDSDFELILKTFFTYQTTFTDSIEKSLAIITETILHSWQGDAANAPPSSSSGSSSGDQPVLSIAQLDRKIARLRHELREAHDMFDQTDERAEKVMLYYREELEQVEQIHQADCELLELQQDKVNKLLDVFERIDSRFCQLEIEQDELTMHAEALRRIVMQYLKREPATTPLPDAYLKLCAINLTQSLIILSTVPSTDPTLRLREDWCRLLNDLEQVITQLLQSPEAKTDNDDLAALEKKWRLVRDTMKRENGANGNKTTLSPHPSSSSSSSSSADATNTAATPISNGSSQVSSVSSSTDTTVTSTLSTTYWQQQRLTATLYSSALVAPSTMDAQSLNELELQFEILSANLSEIQHDMNAAQIHTKQILGGKKRMYDACLALEKELDQSKRALGGRSSSIVQEELETVMHCTRALFERQKQVDARLSLLKTEHDRVQDQLDATKHALRQVRPPLLLQGLLERLETVDGPNIHVEKDWQEDASLVMHVPASVADGLVVDDVEKDLALLFKSGNSKDNHAADVARLKHMCQYPMVLQCLLTRMDTSLYCLKVLAKHHINRARQVLVDVQTALGQASLEVQEAHSQMTILYDEAAEVARQVYVFKTEVEMIIRHRKEEVVKVWEVVDEVSAGLDTKVQHGQVLAASDNDPHRAAINVDDDDDATLPTNEDHDRHQWILRELERFQIVHENLQDAIEDLKREQTDLGQRIRHLTTALIEPQVDKLVGQNDISLLSLSDHFADMIDAIRMHDAGTNVDGKWSSSHSPSAPSTNAPAAPHNASQTSIMSANASTTASVRSSANRAILSAAMEHGKRASVAMSLHTVDRKRMSVMSTSSLSSLSSYQQERMLSRASNLSLAVKQRSLLS
ncbi:hypothetical protein BC940DRAFT_259800 [Gongronella butleri]|nr:hypothetical protein BC940DRAFT_259800 [Gongronella butleri]